MSTTDFIDPVSGFPIVVNDSIIQQIPLGQNIIPFADLSATDRPTRLPLYPDDVIPTLSSVVAQRQKVPRAISASLVKDPEGGKELVPALNVNSIGAAAGGSGLGDITVFTHVFDESLNTNEPYAASPAFTPLQGITALQFWVMGAAQNDEWQPQYIHLHVGPAGDNTDPILLIVAPFHDNHAADASPQFVSAHAEVAFNGYVNQAGAWKGTALKASVENASPGFGWLDGAGCTIYYV